jgi:hypothetical protein
MQICLRNFTSEHLRLGEEKTQMRKLNFSDELGAQLDYCAKACGMRPQSLATRLLSQGLAAVIKRDREYQEVAQGVLRRVSEEMASE